MSHKLMIASSPSNSCPTKKVSGSNATSLPDTLLTHWCYDYPHTAQKLMYLFKHGRRGRFKREEEEDSPHDYTPDLSGVRGKSIILMFVVVCDLVEVQYLIKLLPG